MGLLYVSFFKFTIWAVPYNREEMIQWDNEQQRIYINAYYLGGHTC